MKIRINVYALVFLFAFLLMGTTVYAVQREVSFGSFTNRRLQTHLVDTPDVYYKLMEHPDKVDDKWIYTPQCIDCHLTFAVRYNGWLAPGGIDMDRNALQNMLSANALRGHTDSVKGLEFYILLPTEYTYTEYEYDTTCEMVKFDDVNGTGEREVCDTITTPIERTDWKYEWTGLDDIEQMDLKKDEWLFVDLRGSVEPGRIVDIVPSVNMAGVSGDVDEWAWWNADYNLRYNITFTNSTSIDDFFPVPVELNSTSGMTGYDYHEYVLLNSTGDEITFAFGDDGNSTIDNGENITFEYGKMCDGEPCGAPFSLYTDCESCSSGDAKNATYESVLYNVLYDDFEDGDISDWDTCTGCSLNTTNPYEGSYSLYLDDTGGTDYLAMKTFEYNVYHGLKMQVADSVEGGGTANIVMTYLKDDSDNSASVYRYKNNNVDHYSAESWTQLCGSCYDIGSWYVDEMTLDIPNEQYDISHNGASASSQSFTTSVTFVDRYVHTSGAAEDGEASMDALKIQFWTSGTVDGFFTGSEETRNTAPTVESNVISDTTPDYGETVYHTLTAQDADSGDTITSYCYFYKNDVNQTDFAMSQVVENDTATQMINVTSDELSGDDAVIFGCKVSDGNTMSAETNTSTATIQKASTTTNVAPTTQTITYPETITQYCSGDSPETECTLWREIDVNPPTINITDLNDTTESLTAGTWYFKANTTETANYSSSTSSVQTITVDKASTTIYEAVNGTEADHTATYPDAVNVTGWKDVDGGTLTLKRDGVSKDTGSVVVEEVLLGVGSHNYTTSLSHDNYTAPQVERTVTINENDTYGVNLYLNGTDGDLTGLNGTSFNFTVVSGIPEDIYINTNHTGWSVVSGASPFSNYSTLSTSSAPTAINVTGYIDNENYTNVQEEHTLTLVDVSLAGEEYEETVLSGSMQEFKTIFEVPSPVDDLEATLIYNNTYYTNDSFAKNTTHWNFSKTLEVPEIGSDTKNITFYWNYSYMKNTHYELNTSSHQQNVSKPQLVECGDALSGEKTLLMSILDEQDFSSINGTMNMLFTLKPGEERYDYNFSVENETFSLCLFPEYESYQVNATMEYDSDGYDPRRWYLRNETLSNTTTSLNIYLLNDTVGDRVDITVEDPVGSGQEDVYIEIQRWYVELDEFRTVAMAKTDVNGETLSYLQLYDKEYRFLLSQHLELVETIESKLIGSTSLAFTINPSVTNPIYEWFNNIGHSCTYDNATNVMTCSGTDGTTDQLVTRFCLNVTEFNSTWTNDTCSLCADGPTATLTCDFGNTTERMFKYKFLAKLSYDYIDSIVLETDWKDFTTGLSEVYDDMGLFIGLIMIGTTLMAGIWYPPVGILLTMVSMGMSIWLGFLDIEMYYFVGMCIVGIAIMLNWMRN